MDSSGVGAKNAALLDKQFTRVQMEQQHERGASASSAQRAQSFAHVLQAEQVSQTKITRLDATRLNASHRVRGPKRRQAESRDAEDEGQEAIREATVHEALGHGEPYGARQLYELNGMVMMMGRKKDD
ncbi:MAG TPA: hypothetical protein VFH51_00875, partial [Myxococcota bacterium]|nr:hypothetical protein [Myxococcota bacterium]